MSKSVTGTKKPHPNKQKHPEAVGADMVKENISCNEIHMLDKNLKKNANFAEDLMICHYFYFLSFNLMTATVLVV